MYVCYLQWIDVCVCMYMHIDRLFGSAVEPAFHRISIFFFFAKIECGLYFLDRFDVLMSKMIFKK